MKKGLSLAELLAVIVVSGIILSISIPLVSKLIDKVRKDAFIADIKVIEEASKLYCNSNHSDQFCLKKSDSEVTYSLKEPSILNSYISKDFSKYAESYVKSTDVFKINLKNNVYETREILYSEDDKTFMYIRQEILPDKDISNKVIKNK